MLKCVRNGTLFDFIPKLQNVFLPVVHYQRLPPQTLTLQGPVHTELLVIALTMKKEGRKGRIPIPLLLRAQCERDLTSKINSWTCQKSCQKNFSFLWDISFFDWSHQVCAYLSSLDIITFVVFDEVPLIKICALLTDLSSGGSLFRHLILSVRITV